MPNAQTAICLDADYKIPAILTKSKPGLAFVTIAMGPFDFLNHLLNFALPAAVLGVSVAVLAPVLLRKVPVARTVRSQVAINFVASMVALIAGLLVFGRDGKMATYACMVLACASSQWWSMRR